jgi:hypothetical protein
LAARRQLEALTLLSPAGFGAEAARMQRLTVAADRGGTELTLDAAVEIDAGEVRVAGFLLGQRVLLLSWDGVRLLESRDPMVPAAVKGRAILRDLQLVYWPAAAVVAALPSGCSLEDSGSHRKITCGGAVVLEVQREDALPLGAARIHDHAGRYRITIEAAQ